MRTSETMRRGAARPLRGAGRPLCGAGRPLRGALCASLVAVAVSLAACGDQSGSPQPVPIPNSKVFRSTTVLPGQPEEVRLVGLPKATVGIGEVRVVNRDRGGEAIAQASTKGSFYAAILADAGEVLEVSYEGSEPALYTVPEEGVTGAPAPTPIAGTPPLERLAGTAQVRLRGEAPAGTTSVLAVATVGGDTVIAPVDAQLRFDTTLLASPGETVEVFVNFGELGSPWTLTAP